MVEHVLGLERLINGQVDGVVGVGDAPGGVGRRLDVVVLLVDDVLLLDHVLRFVVAAEALLALQRGRHSLVVGLAEARHPVPPQPLEEGQPLGAFLLFAVLLFGGVVVARDVVHRTLEHAEHQVVGGLLAPAVEVPADRHQAQFSRRAVQTLLFRPIHVAEHH